jgi:hypothetical protein
MADKVLRVEKLAYYEVRTIERDGSGNGTPNWVEQGAYTPEGLYIGSPEVAHILTQEYGIVKLYAVSPHSNRADIGQDKDGTWWAWRGCGRPKAFKVGERVEANEYANTINVEVIEDEKQAKRLAIAYARYL